MIGIHEDYRDSESPRATEFLTQLTSSTHTRPELSISTIDDGALQPTV